MAAVVNNLTVLFLVLLMHKGYLLSCYSCMDRADCEKVSYEDIQVECDYNQNVTCFQVQYYLRDVDVVFTERGCWPENELQSWEFVDISENICDILEEGESWDLLHCSQCKADNCNRLDLSN